MISVLTTRERDILQLLLGESAPITTSDIARRLRLSPRQVRYSLKGVRSWLVNQGDFELVTKRNVGIELVGPKGLIRQLGEDLFSDQNFRLILDSGQRQQLLAIQLILATEPSILAQLEQLFNVSRTTLIKDLGLLQQWVEEWDLVLDSRPNFGYDINGAERVRRQAIAVLLWGDDRFGTPIAQLSFGEGLQFDLQSDFHLLPGAQYAGKLIAQLDVARALPIVAEAEAKLNGRLNDEAVLYVALCLAIQNQRVKHGHTLEESRKTIDKLKTLRVWNVSRHVAAKLGISLSKKWSDDEVAYIAILLLTTARNDRWPADLDYDDSLTELIDVLMAYVAQAFEIPKLKNDTTLHDGLAVHIIPACLRVRFGYKTPPYQEQTILSDKYSAEKRIAEGVIREIVKFTGLPLPASEVNDIALLLRAAYIRERPSRLEKVLVICPSGMAVAQLLTARLKARFPRLGSVEVVSVRRLTEERIRSAQLLITTVPLPGWVADHIDVVQVNPLLMPEDIEKITRFMA